jgi:hypothetical protein
MGEREQGVINLLNRCADYYSIQEIRELRFGTNDRDQQPGIYSLCYNKNEPNNEKYCGVDYVFWAWPTASIFNYKETRDKIIELSKNEPIIQKVGWFGNIYSPTQEVIEHKTRPLLKELGDKYPEIFDIHHVQPQHGTITKNIHNFLSLPDLTKYKYLIDIGGNGYSGRLKFLFFSKRPIFLVDRNHIEFYHKYLIPYYHYIPVNMDLSDLISQYYWAEQNPEKVAEIAENAFNFAMENFTDEKLNERIYQVWKNINNID